MSSHKARPNKIESPEMRAAMVRNDVYSIIVEREFRREYGHLSNAELAKAAHDMEMLGFRLRHLLWNRHDKNYQGN